MNKIFDLKKAIKDHIKSGQSIMIGGFGRGGVPFTVLEELADNNKEINNLTLFKNDANEPDLGIGKLLKNKQVKKLFSTHIGLNPEFINQMNSGEIECELVPQGIFAEKIRAGGAGIPAFFSDIGIETSYEEGKELANLDNKKYIIERAYKADLAIICADIVDEIGNCWWAGTNRNMCTVMATACSKVIVEAKKIVKVGEIKPENVHLPAAFVDIIIQASKRNHMKGENEL